MKVSVGELAALGGFLVLVAAAAAIGSVWTGSAVSSWYDALEKPAWTPSGQFIGLVWSVLYLLMAVAAWLVWREVGLASWPMGLFFAQLVLNVAWSGIFFGLRAPGWALVELVALALAVAWTLVAFWRVSRTAGALMVPYLAWVVFAGYLNWLIWRLNV